MVKVKPTNFLPDIAPLKIANKAKRVIESFLEEECTPSVGFSPKRSARMRKAIIEGVKAAISVNWNEDRSISTFSLAYELRDIADGHRNAHRKSVANNLEILSGLLESIATPLRKKSKNI